MRTTFEIFSCTKKDRSHINIILNYWVPLSPIVIMLYFIAKFNVLQKVSIRNYVNKIRSMIFLKLMNI